MKARGRLASGDTCPTSNNLRAKVGRTSLPNVACFVAPEASDSTRPTGPGLDRSLNSKLRYGEPPCWRGTPGASQQVEPDRLSVKIHSGTAGNKINGSGELQFAIRPGRPSAWRTEVRRYRSLLPGMAN